MTITRRSFSKGVGAALGLGVIGAPAIVRAQSKGRLVVIGGGAGGATVAKYVARDSKGAVDVTLVQEAPLYTTCFYSNLYLGGLRSFDSITHGYSTLAMKYGVKTVFERAMEIDTAGKKVKLAGGSTLEYDALVVAPGIAIQYDSIEGYSREAADHMPHS